MNCPRCNVELSFKKKRCDNCGQDLRVYRRVLSLSNSCYNQALSQARVRDLSGAEVSLKKSLKFNKKNTNARNLLGLIYFEKGEIVEALSEWVISKHFQDEDNEADYYISQVQANPSRLENYSQMVRKYNSALSSAKNGDEDMAIIQLKKVVNMNPRFIRANQLLALLYMMTGKKENRIKAYRLLKNISKIDVTNTTTLRYLKELSDVQGKSENAQNKIVAKSAEETVRRTMPRADENAYKPITLYKEEKPSVLPFVHALLGVVIGIVLTWFIIVPQINNKANKNENEDFKKYSENLATNDSDVSTLENQNKQLQEKVDELEAQLDGSSSESLAEEYGELLSAIQYYLDDNSLEAAEALVNVSRSNLQEQSAKKLYTRIKKATFADASVTYFENGRDCYNGEGEYAGKQDYDEAIKLLEQSLQFDADNTDAMYFLGRCYQQKSDTDKAKEYYNQIVNDYPDSARLSEAQSRLREMGE